MTKTPESGVDYCILPKEEAIALAKWFQHEYIHYDKIDVHSAVNKIIKFAERVEKQAENEQHETDRGSGVSDSNENDSASVGRSNRKSGNGSEAQPSLSEGISEGNEDKA